MQVFFRRAGLLFILSCAACSDGGVRGGDASARFDAAIEPPAGDAATTGNDALGPSDAAAAKPLWQEVAAASDGKIHLLFIGNSLTYYTASDPMPATLAQLSVGRAHPVAPTMITTDGFHLQDHWDDPQHRAVDAIHTRAFNVVVLQEYSDYPNTNPASYEMYAQLFDKEIKDAGALTVLYLTFANSDRPGDQAGLTVENIKLGGLLGDHVSPVGEAWKSALSSPELPGLVLHNLPDDTKHPNAKGAFLTGAVFYAMIYGVSANGLAAPADVDPAVVTALEDVAWATVNRAMPW